MKLLCLLPLLGLFVLTGCPQEPAPSPPPEDPQEPAPIYFVEVSLHEVLTEIELFNHNLSYRWQAPPEGAGNLVDPSEYFWRSQETTLNSDQYAMIRRWVAEHDVFSLTPPDTPGDPEAFPAAFFHRLHVAMDGQTFDLSWTDAATWDDMNQHAAVVNAVEALKSLCAEFTVTGEDDESEGKK